MPTYPELRSEEWWGDQFEPPALAAYNTRLRTFYGHTRIQTGSPGDNNHLKGRHRSINWCLNSAFCTNRAYATTDPRDRRGGWNWYRATDTGITGRTLYEACKRLDAAVRAGRLLGLAEWFGTFDGVNVVGWFEGKPSNNASTSHLTHLHTGYWTEHADDHELFDLLFEVITGTGGDDVDKTQDALLYNASSVSAQLARMADTAKVKITSGEHVGEFAPVPLDLALTAAVKGLQSDMVAVKASQAAILSRLNDLAAGTSGGPVDVSAASLDEIEARVDKQLDEAFSGGADQAT